MWPENMCQWNWFGLVVISYFSMNVVGSHTSESFVAHAWFAMALLFPHTKTGSENTCTSVFNKFHIGESSRDILLQDSVEALFLKCSMWFAQLQQLFLGEFDGSSQFL